MLVPDLPAGQAGLPTGQACPPAGRQVAIGIAYEPLFIIYGIT